MGSLAIDKKPADAQVRTSPQTSHPPSAPSAPIEYQIPPHKHEKAASRIASPDGEQDPTNSVASLTPARGACTSDHATIPDPTAQQRKSQSRTEPVMHSEAAELMDVLDRARELDRLRKKRIVEGGY